jgi:hypothetical protein
MQGVEMNLFTPYIFFHPQPPPPGKGVRQVLINSIVQKAKSDQNLAMRILKEPTTALKSYKLTSIEITEVVQEVKALNLRGIWPSD